MRRLALIFTLAFLIGSCASSSQGQTYHCRDFLTSDAETSPREFGLAEPYNISIVMGYGTANGSSPTDVGDYVAKLLADERDAFADLPSFVNFDTRLFVRCIEKDGISVAFLMGGVSVGPVDIHSAITSAVLRQVVEKRASSTRLLYNGFPSD